MFYIKINKFAKKLFTLKIINEDFNKIIKKWQKNLNFTNLKILFSGIVLKKCGYSFFEFLKRAPSALYDIVTVLNVPASPTRGATVAEHAGPER